jgi:hypothetical protein
MPVFAVVVQIAQKHSNPIIRALKLDCTKTRNQIAGSAVCTAFVTGLHVVASHTFKPSVVFVVFAQIVYTVWPGRLSHDQGTAQA